MDVTAMRDTLTPLENDRTLKLRIDPYKNQINDISYEVLSADGSRTLENTKVNKAEEEDGCLNVTLSLQDDLLINTECGTFDISSTVYFFVSVHLAPHDISPFTRSLPAFLRE